MMKPKSKVKTAKKAEPGVERLSAGRPAKVGKKEMLKLTNKNYEMLPEVQRKREEEAARAEYVERMRNVQALEEKRVAMAD